ncbi:MAG: hypothetical protein H6741_06125 [Alphaproteobacteria bacterium]|nr:hypothetical protein [Alphaproteobacteria bacterium]MCB9792286.1 hypothetical protein [Alphaproteobacteria bacterium]
MIGFAGGLHPQGVRGGDARVVESLLASLPQLRPEEVPRCNKVHVHLGGGTLPPAEGAGGPAIRGDWTVVLAGELDNLPALRREMVARHLEPETVSAAELAARIFGECGVPHALERLEGDYSFAAWDAEGQALWLYRGRAGAWPVYLGGLSTGATLFSTSLRALLAVMPPLSPDRDAAALFFDTGRLGEGQAPFQELRALAPGELRVIDPRGARRVQGWDPGRPPPGRAGDRPKWARSVGVTLHLAAVRRAPEGARLRLLDGGGVFSGALAGALSGAGRPFETLALAGAGLPPDEALLIELTEDLVAFDALVEALDQPAPDPALLIQHALLQGARGPGAAMGGWGGAALFYAALPRERRRRRLLGRWLQEPLPPQHPLELSDRVLRPLAELARAEGQVLRAPLADPSLQALARQIPAGFHQEGQRALFVSGMQEALGERVGRPHSPPHLALGPWTEGLLDERMDQAFETLADWATPEALRALLLPERPDAESRLRTWRGLSWAAWAESLR